jgi:hypothetical protein
MALRCSGALCKSVGSVFTTAGRRLSGVLRCGALMPATRHKSIKTLFLPLPI